MKAPIYHPELPYFWNVKVRKALDMGADVNSRIAGNDTALMNAALKGHVKIAQLLVLTKTLTPTLTLTLIYPEL
eukprot:680241-Amorphochlora_amoeboformis.AAC.1